MSGHHQMVRGLSPRMKYIVSSWSSTVNVKCPSSTSAILRRLWGDTSFCRSMSCTAM